MKCDPTMAAGSWNVAETETLFLDEPSPYDGWTSKSGHWPVLRYSWDATDSRDRQNQHTPIFTISLTISESFRRVVLQWSLHEGRVLWCSYAVTLCGIQILGRSIPVPSHCIFGRVGRT